MKISVKSDIKKLTRRVNGFSDQIPFAVSRALNMTAFDARGGTQEQIKKDIDRPTPWTLRGVGYKNSNKNNLTALVFIRPDRWRYLVFQVSGGTRTPQRQYIAVPAGVRRNKYGNPSRGAIARLLARPDVFSATIRGTHGIWQRTKRGALKLLYLYQLQVNYQGGLLDYYGAVNRIVAKRFGQHFRQTFKQAVKSARI